MSASHLAVPVDTLRKGKKLQAGGCTCGGASHIFYATMKLPALYRQAGSPKLPPAE